MTSNRSLFHVSQLLLAFQLFIVFHTVILPLTARNIKSSGVNKSHHSEILVIMASGINVTTIYNSFSEFKNMFGVEFPDDRRIAFKNGEGRFHSSRVFRKPKAHPSQPDNINTTRGHRNCKTTPYFIP